MRYNRSATNSSLAAPRRADTLIEQLGGERNDGNTRIVPEILVQGEKQRAIRNVAEVISKFLDNPRGGDETASVLFGEFIGVLVVLVAMIQQGDLERRIRKDGLHRFAAP